MSIGPPATSDIAITLTDVWVQYRLRHAHHYNLKRTATNVIARRTEDPAVVTALRAVTLSIPKGARVGIKGPNGAGKSTLLAVMAGVLAPSRGTASVNGRILALLGSPDEGLDPEQTGRENALSLGVRLGERTDAMHSRLEEIREFSGLGSRFEHPVYTYSSGMQVRLRFTAITSIRADVLLVDEGIGSADAEFNARAAERLRDFFAASGTLILATHSDEMLARHCTESLLLTEGEVEAWP
jgi:ABC-2 type transport system ATP-binding protein